MKNFWNCFSKPVLWIFVLALFQAAVIGTPYLSSGVKNDFFQFNPYERCLLHLNSSSANRTPGLPLRSQSLCSNEKLLDEVSQHGRETPSTPPMISRPACVLGAGHRRIGDAVARAHPSSTGCHYRSIWERETLKNKPSLIPDAPKDISIFMDKVQSDWSSLIQPSVIGTHEKEQTVARQNSSYSGAGFSHVIFVGDSITVQLAAFLSCDLARTGQYSIRPCNASAVHAFQQQNNRKGKGDWVGTASGFSRGVFESGHTMHHAGSCDVVQRSFSSLSTGIKMTQYFKSGTSTGDGSPSCHRPRRLATATGTAASNTVRNQIHRSVQHASLSHGRHSLRDRQQAAARAAVRSGVGTQPRPVGVYRPGHLRQQLYSGLNWNASASVGSVSKATVDPGGPFAAEVLIMSIRSDPPCVYSKCADVNQSMFDYIQRLTLPPNALVVFNFGLHLHRHILGDDYEATSNALARALLWKAAEMRRMDLNREEGGDGGGADGGGGGKGGSPGRSRLVFRETTAQHFAYSRDGRFVEGAQHLLTGGFCCDSFHAENINATAQAEIVEIQKSRQPATQGKPEQQGQQKAEEQPLGLIAQEGADTTKDPRDVQLLSALEAADPQWRRLLGWAPLYASSRTLLAELHTEARGDCSHFIYVPGISSLLLRGISSALHELRAYDPSP